jgi:hypothetical protein
LALQESGQPDLVNEHLLVSGFPERADFIRLMLRRKGLFLDTQGQEVLEMTGLGIAATRLPPHHGLPGDSQKVGEPRLG